MTRFAHHTVLNAFSGSCLMLANLFSGIVVARLLGTEGTGTVVFSLWIASVTTPIIGGGISASIARVLPELRGRGEGRQAQAFAAWHSRRLLAFLLLTLAGFVLVILIQSSMVARVGVLLNSESSGAWSRVLLFLLPLLVAAQVLALFGVELPSRNTGLFPLCPAFSLVAWHTGRSSRHWGVLSWGARSDRRISDSPATARICCLEAVAT